MYTLLYSRWITDGDLLIAHGTLLNVCGILDGRATGGRMDTYICMSASLCCLPEIIKTLLTGYKKINVCFMNIKRNKRVMHGCMDTEFCGIRYNEHRRSH